MHDPISLVVLVGYIPLAGHLVGSGLEDLDSHLPDPAAGQVVHVFGRVLRRHIHRRKLSPNPPIRGGALAPRHTISRPGVCAPRSRSYCCAHSGARRRPTIWRTWTPTRSPRTGGSGLNARRPASVAISEVTENRAAVSRLYAVSDLHVGNPVNRQAVAGIPSHPDDQLIVAGDEAERFAGMPSALGTL